MAIPSSDKAVGQTGHTSDHNLIAAELARLTQPAVTVVRDSSGRVTSTNENSVETTYTRNSLGQVTSFSREGTTWSISRNADGSVQGVVEL